MNKEEFLIYCLLYAFDAAGIKKQNLVQMALRTDTVGFVKVYNRYALDGEEARLNSVEAGKESYINSGGDLDLFINDIKSIFFNGNDFEFDVLIFDKLRNILA